MARITVGEQLVEDVAPAVSVVMLQGERTTIPFDWREGDAAIDLSQYDISCTATEHTCTLSGGDISRLVAVEGAQPRTLAVTKVAGTTGRFTVEIPSDLHTGEIPLDAITGLPCYVAFITVSAPGGGDIDKLRLMIAQRAG